LVIGSQSAENTIETHDVTSDFLNELTHFKKTNQPINWLAVCIRYDY
jgi:hypothetical protein